MSNKKAFKNRRSPLYSISLSELTLFYQREKTKFHSVRLSKMFNSCTSVCLHTCALEQYKIEKRQRNRLQEEGKQQIVNSHQDDFLSMIKNTQHGALETNTIFHTCTVQQCSMLMKWTLCYLTCMPIKACDCHCSPWYCKRLRDAPQAPANAYPTAHMLDYVSYSTYPTARIIQHVSYSTCRTARVVQHVSYSTCRTARVVQHVSYSTYLTLCIVQQISYTMYPTTRIQHYVSYSTYAIARIQHYVSYSTYPTVCILQHVSYSTYHKARILHHVSYTRYSTTRILY